MKTLTDLSLFCLAFLIIAVGSSLLWIEDKVVRVWKWVKGA